jgi:energy-coupling factor transporter ATP-binding protein EcfA2
MNADLKALLDGAKNFVFLGESGCGKSEIALNLACLFAERQETHLFDLDQTKPLSRARDVYAQMREKGVRMRYLDQFYDAPTLVGGVPESLAAPDRTTILDVGGSENGARMIGRFSGMLNRPDTKVFYVVNPYRAWSGDIAGVDGTLSAVLRVTRIQNVRFLANPNLGAGTTEREFFTGLERAREILELYAPIEGACVRAELFERTRGRAGMPLMPLHLYMKQIGTE